MSKYLYIPLLISTAAIALFVWVTYTMPIVWVFVPAVIITYIIYWQTFYKQVPKPERILPLYLFLLGIQFLQLPKNT